MASSKAEPVEATTENLAELIERKDHEILAQLGGVGGIALSLESDIHHGVDVADVEKLREKFGKNELPPPEQVTFWGLVWDALKDPLLRILIIAAIVSIIFGMTLKDPHTGEVNREVGWIEGTAILISVSLVTLVTATNDYRKAKKFEKLNAETSRKDVEVIRGKEKRSVDISDLVVGDVLQVCAGQTLAADGVLISGQDLVVDESSMTGESDPVKKKLDADIFFISGTDVVEGVGQILVVGVGESSFAGKVAMSTRGEGADTPLQVKLSRLADDIGKGGLLGAGITFLILSIKELVKIIKGDTSFNISMFLDFLLVAVTLVVVAVPEGLPLAVTIALAYSMKEMMADNCLVRVLAACETMGGANAVCSDKTGTLTTNQMTVVQGWIAGDNFVFAGYGVQGGEGATVTESSDKGVKLASRPETVQFVCDALSLNSNSEQLTNGAVTSWVGGNKTEHGLLGFVLRTGRSFVQLRNKVAPSDRRLFPFSSAKKRSTTIVRDGERFVVHVKGASEMVLEDCNQVMCADGHTIPLTEAYQASITQVITQMADQGNRTIAIAYAYMPAGSAEFPENEPSPPLTFLAVLGLQDPIRVEVPKAVAQCHSAGIVVRMVTGDNMNTAIAIAKKCGLLPPGQVEEGAAMDGRTFRQLASKDPKRLLELIPKLRVLARSTPTDKLTLVSCLMDEGDIVAVTGDGTNDAPALKLADVGFAMNTGTDIAKGASDMILMDDNFASVVKATCWGRTVNDNIRKFLQFQLTINVSGVLLTLVGSAISDDNSEPLKPVQLLWLNLIMDTLAALALATEKPTITCLDRPPISRATPLISYRMRIFVVLHGVLQLLFVLLLVNFGQNVFQTGACMKDDDIKIRDDHGCGDYTAPNGTIQYGCSKENCKGGLVHQTCIFNLFIWLQLFNWFNARKLYGGINIFAGLTRSKPFLVIWILCVGFQIIAVELFGRFMSTTSLSPRQWGLCIAFAAIELPWGFIINLIKWPEWKPGPNTDNRKGLDAQKRSDIRKAKISAGMISEDTPEEKIVEEEEGVSWWKKCCCCCRPSERKQSFIRANKDRSASVMNVPTMSKPVRHSSAVQVHPM